MALTSNSFSFLLSYVSRDQCLKYKQSFTMHSQKDLVIITFSCTQMYYIYGHIKCWPPFFFFYSFLPLRRRPQPKNVKLIHISSVWWKLPKLYTESMSLSLIKMCNLICLGRNSVNLKADSFPDKKSKPSNKV